jgi:hypothetical protein
MNREPNHEAIQNAVDRLKSGENPESVLRFIYHLGETEGMLKMARTAENAVLKLLEVA